MYDSYRQAGRIAAEAREYGASLLKPGALFLDVASKVEARILEKGAGLAFPVNLACNTLAAHYSPHADDPSTFSRGDVVKLDVGAHVNGYIADTAVTVEIGTHIYEKMITASSEALNQAITHCNAHTPLSAIGEVIEQTITSYGYKPIDNLMGHGLGCYELHTGVSIPNIGSYGGSTTLSEGDVVAIEPFATNGAGHVIAGKGSNIYLCTNSFKAKLIRDAKTKGVYAKLLSQFKTLPFAQRWCDSLVQSNVDVALRKLSFYGLTKQYPQLVEAKNGTVTQKEHTVIVREEDCEVIT
ncbi:MAG: type II methionyl aminopeptidase [Candidatus Thermoplasmatota archaeon]|nr:type II methionyl aminopeptidase [Candidatus Thermoplasmatota archaeon]